MVEVQEAKKEILKAYFTNYYQYLNSSLQNLDTQHTYLTQSAIFREIWENTTRRGYRNKEFLSKILEKLTIDEFLERKPGKQNAILYFPTEKGLIKGRVIMNQNLKGAKCFIDGANVVYHPNRKVPTLNNVLMVLDSIKTFFGYKPVMTHVVMKPSVRHRLPKDEQDLFSQLERDNVIIQSFLGGGQTDDIHILRLVNDFQKLGNEVWVVTNDQYRDHLTDFPWYKNFSNKVEYRIIGDLVQFNPEKLGGKTVSFSPPEVIEQQITDETTRGELEIVKIGQIPQDASPTAFSDPKDLIDMAQSNNIRKIFVTETRGNQKTLWFVFEGKLFTHNMRLIFEDDFTLEEYLEALEVKVSTIDEYRTWKQGKLAQKGWPNYQLFKNFQRRLLERTFTPTDSIFGYRSEIASGLHERFTHIKDQILIDEPDTLPDYEPLCLREFDWIVWLISKDSGWSSMEAICTFLYNLVDLDMFAQKASFYSIFLRYLALTKPSEVADLTERTIFRKQFWTHFTGETISPHPTSEFQFFFNQEEKELCQELLTRMKNLSFDALIDFPLEPLNDAQFFLYLKIQENGWSSYREFLEKAREFLTIGLWKEMTVLELEKSDSGLELLELTEGPWHHTFLNAGNFVKKFLIFLSSINPDTTSELQLKILAKYRVEIFLGGQSLTTIDEHRAKKRGRS